jgi:L1 cell adhesion molecule like protein
MQDQIVKTHQKSRKVTITQGDDKNPTYEFEFYEEDSEEARVIKTSVIDVTASYLTKLKETAEYFLGKMVDGCVISIPAHFEEKQKKDLLKAAHKAGFKSSYAIHEPVAAVMAFNASIQAENDVQDKNVLVLDLGAEAFNISLISNHDGLYTIEESVEEENLGGLMFDQVLVEIAKEEFKRKTKLDISDNKRSLSKLQLACEATKRSLTNQDTAPCFVEALYEGMDYNGSIVRGRFDMLAEPLYARCTEAVKKTLRNAKVTADEISQVIVIGGASRLPKFQKVMKDLFPNIGNEFRTEVEPDEAIALGCAVQAGILRDANIDLDTEFDKACTDAKHLTKTIGIISGAGKFVPVIPAGTPLPVRRSFTVKLDKAQNNVYLAINELTEGKPELISEVALTDIPTGQDRLVEVVFLIELDHHLDVTITEKVSGETVNVVLK